MLKIKVGSNKKNVCNLLIIYTVVSFNKPWQAKIINFF